MEARGLGSSGSPRSAGAGFRTGATPPRPHSKDTFLASLGEPVRKLQTTPDLVIENTCDFPIISFSQTVPERILPAAEIGFAERPHVHFPDDVEPQRIAAPNPPLLVDARVTRGSSEEEAFNKSDTSFHECATLRGMNLEGAWPESSCNDGWQSPGHPSWPEATAGGGATCSGPPHAARKRTAAQHEPMGEVLLLGSGLRAAESARLESSTSALEKSRAEANKTKAVVQEKMPSGTGVSVVLRKNVVSSTAAPDALSGMGVMRAKKVEDRADDVTKKGSQEASKSEMKSIYQDSTSKPSPNISPSFTAKDPTTATITSRGSSPKASSTKQMEATAETDILDEIQERLQDEIIKAVVERHEIGLQTDEVPRGCFGGAQEAGVSAENQRILLLQRCDPNQVNLTSWMPLPKPRIPIPAEMKYLAHVRSRFPGTVDTNCCLERPPVSRRSRHACDAKANWYLMSARGKNPDKEKTLTGLQHNEKTSTRASSV